MKFSKAAVLALAVGSTTAFVPLASRPQESSVAVRTMTRVFSTTEEEVTEDTSSARTDGKAYKKDDRLRMMKSERFHRRGFKEVREDAEKRLETEYMSDLVKDLKTSNYVMERDGVKVYLAKV
jgi:4-hydroxy-3-methylbut-2-enyl diphosphate reductase